MAALDLRSGSADIHAHVGDDVTITVTVLDSAGDPVDVSGYTIVANVLRGTTVVETFADSVGGAGNNVITLTLTDTQTTTIGTESHLRWSLSTTSSGTTRQYVGGAFQLFHAGEPTGSGSSSVSVSLAGAVTLTLTVAAAAGGGASALDDLSDVTISSPSSGQVLKYNGSAWVNGTDATAGGTTALDDLSDVAITAAASGDVLRHNGTTWVDTPGTDHYEAAGAVAAHEADTASVHGITDTSALIDTSDSPADLAANAATTQTGTTYSLVSGDDCTSVICSNAAAVTVTVPTNATTALRTGFRVLLVSSGAGGVTLSTTGITLIGSSPNTTIAQNEGMYLEKTATDTWIVLGGTAA